MNANIRNKCLLASLFLAMVNCSSAANVELIAWPPLDAPIPGDGRKLPALVGEIKSGDADRLIAFVKAQTRSPGTLLLDSPGGSVAEAIRIAQVVKKLSLMVLVLPGRVCASACFFIFAAGTGRSAWEAERISQLGQPPTNRWEQPLGFVGLHRPYLGSIAGPDKKQEQIMRSVAAYLDGEMVSRRLVDIMMSRSSVDIYWLNKEDLRMLGQASPAVEEYAIRKCGFDYYVK